jgi:hypothetical protein
MPSHALPPDQSRARQRARVRSRVGPAVVLAVPVGVGAALFGNGSQQHAGVAYYCISVLVVAIVIVADVLGFFAASRFAAVSVRRMPRSLYGLLTLGFAVPVAAFVRAALEHARNHTMNQGGWAPMVGGMVATYCLVAGLIMAGRALAWGRARRAFWIFPPQWLDHELQDRTP